MNRRFESVTVRPTVSRGRLELRIHGQGSKGGGDRWTPLRVDEACCLGYELLLKAEKLAIDLKKRMTA